MRLLAWNDIVATKMKRNGMPTRFPTGKYKTRGKKEAGENEKLQPVWIYLSNAMDENIFHPLVHGGIL
jgi:hypothetical protein